MVSFVLVLVVTAAWLDAVRDRQPRWWLVPLTWLWACAHGLWLAGVITGFATVVGIALDRKTPLRILFRLAAVPLLSVVAAAMTPVGPRLLLTPFEVSGYAMYVSEWRPAGLNSPFFMAATALVVGCALLWARSGSAPWPHLAVRATGPVWMLAYTRTVSVGALTLAPLAAATLARGDVARLPEVADA